MDLKVKELLRRFDCAMSVAQSWRPRLDIAYRYIMPNRNNFYYSVPGQQKDTEIFDTTAVLSARSFASKLHATLTPPFVQWADLTAGANIGDNDKEQVNEMLQQITKVLFKYLNASNFDLAINENYMDLAIGTAVLKIDEGTDDKPFIFAAVPVSEMAFEEDGFGTLDNCYRDFCVKGYDINQLWPKAVIPHDLGQQLEQDDTKEVKIKELTRVNNIDEVNNEYIYTVIECSTNKIIYENTEPSSCWIPFRWSKLSGDVFGRGPGIEMLSSIKRLNQLIELELKAGSLAVAPPFLSYNGSEINTRNFRMVPNALIQVNALPGVKPLEQLIVNPNVQFSEAKAEDYRQQIRKAFYTDPLGPIDTPAKTATEITYRQQQLMEEIGPSFGRLQTELLSRVIDRLLYILSKKGLIPSMRADNKLITVQYRSPLARSQSQSEVLNFQQMFQVLAATVGPEMALMGINVQELPLWLSERFGVDLELIKSPLELQMVQQQIMQLAQQQQIQQLPTPQQAA